MKYNFDEIISRHGTNSYKWDSAERGAVLPMWVADMDFRTAPAVIEALRERVEHGIFGYTRVPEEYYEAVIGWFGRRHGLHVKRESLLYTSGVVPAISAIIKALTCVGDKVVVQTPVYNCFFSSIRNNGCEEVRVPLIYANGRYEMDFEALECAVSDEKVKVMLLCNPHNPAGRVWSREELTRVGEICIRHNVTVVSDEIHCELVYPPHKYTPFASISSEFMYNSVTCLSPSKSFNIAGLQISTIVAEDEAVRNRIDKAININEVCDVNPFGVIATIAAYNKGEDWLMALIDYLHNNYLSMRDFCREHLSAFPITELEGTYLVWMDCSVLGLASEELEKQLLAEADLWLNSGDMYGADNGVFMRWNIACPRERMMDGLQRFYNFVKKYNL